MVAAITFVVASARDRRQRIHQLELARFDGIREALVAYVKSGYGFAQKAKAWEDFTHIGADPATQMKSRWELAELEGQRFADAARVQILVEMSYHSEISEALANEIQHPRNVAQVLNTAQRYIDAEWRRVSSGRAAKVGNVFSAT